MALRLRHAGVVVEVQPQNVHKAVTAGDDIEKLRHWACADAPRLLGLRFTRRIGRAGTTL